MLGSGAGHAPMSLEVIYDDGLIQAWVDQEYGEGVVEVTSALHPVS